MLYLMTFRDRAKFVELDPRGTDYDKLYEDFVGNDSTEKYGWPSLWRASVESNVDGVMINEELCYGGASFYIFKWPGITPDMMNACKRRLKRDRDVARLHVYKITSITNLHLWKEFVKDLPSSDAPAFDIPVSLDN